MPIQLPQLGSFTRTFLLVQSSDHITGLTGQQSSASLLFSKAGGPFTAFTQSLISEVGSGWYSAALRTTDTNTIGNISFHCTATGSDPQDWADQVIAATVTTGTLLDKTGIILSPAQTVTTGTLLDKTGILLSPAQTVTTGTNLDKTNYLGSMTASSVLGNPNVNTVAWSGAAVSAANLAVVSRATSGTAQAGTANTITLAAGASATDGQYVGSIVYLGGGTGSGQTGTVKAYNGTSKVATIYNNWGIVPDSTSVYTVIPGGISINSTSDTVTIGQSFPANFASLGITAGGSLSGSVTTGTNLDKTGYQVPTNIQKGVAFSNFPLLMTDSTNHNPLASLSVALSIAAESATGFTALASSSATEIGLGMYRANFTAGETNVNRFTLKATASGADTRFISVNTQP